MKRGRILKSIAGSLGLGGDVLGAASIRIEGNTQLIIENQLSVTEFSDTTLRIRTSGGGIRVRGKNLVLEGLGASGLVLKGEFSSIEYIQ